MADESDGIAHLLGIGDHSMTFCTTGASTAQPISLTELAKLMAPLQEASKRWLECQETVNGMRNDPRFWAWVDSLPKGDALGIFDRMYGIQLPERPEGM